MTATSSREVNASRGKVSRTPDPRTCDRYYFDGASAPSWPKGASGHTTIHYRVNPSHSGVNTQLTDAQIISAVQQIAQVWQAAVPSVTFAYDGQTSDQPINSNNVVGFLPVAGGAANIPLTFSSDGKTILGFDIQLTTQPPWSWQPCDGASTPCNPYSGSGLDLGQLLAHSWGHVLGLADFAANDEQLLTDAGGIVTGPDCGGGSGLVCRFAVTLGLGDIDGARHLYPASMNAPWPTLYYDQ